jgi:hypothetical protein
MPGVSGGIVPTAQAQSDADPTGININNLSGSGTADDPYVITTASEL